MLDIMIIRWFDSKHAWLLLDLPLIHWDCDSPTNGLTDRPSNRNPRRHLKYALGFQWSSLAFINWTRPYTRHKLLLEGQKAKALQTHERMDGQTEILSSRVASSQLRTFDSPNWLQNYHQWMDLPTNGQTDRQMDGKRERWMDGQALLMRCEYTSKKT